MKVGNAAATHIEAVAYGIREECPTCALQSIDELTVERLELKFNL
jgi:hypothetical protein